MRFQCPSCKAINAIEPGDEGADFACGRCQETIHAPENSLSPQVLLGDFVLREISIKRSHEVDFFATQISLARPAIVKVIKPEFCRNERYVEKFLKAARQAAGLCHPNICPIYAVNRENDIFYLAREVGQQQTLKQDLVKNGVMGWSEALDVIIDVAAALEFGWQQHKITHFNLKPDYILIGPEQHAKLCDLGLAGLDPDENSERIIGTPQYLAPERIVGMKGDNRSDLYSLGITFFFMVTGEFPFAAETTDQIISKHLQEFPRPANQLVSDIPPFICSIIDMLLEKDPNERYLNGSMLIDDLQDVKHGDSPKHAMQGGKITPQAANQTSRHGPLKVRVEKELSADTNLRNHMESEQSTVIQVTKPKPQATAAEPPPAPPAPVVESSPAPPEPADPAPVTAEPAEAVAAPVTPAPAQSTDDTTAQPVEQAGHHDPKQPRPALQDDDFEELTEDSSAEPDTAPPPTNDDNEESDSPVESTSQDNRASSRKKLGNMLGRKKKKVTRFRTKRNMTRTPGRKRKDSNNT